jgi:hypothetical protein
MKNIFQKELDNATKSLETYLITMKVHKFNNIKDTPLKNLALKWNFPRLRSAKGDKVHIGGFCEVLGKLRFLHFFEKFALQALIKSLPKTSFSYAENK